MSQLCAVCPRIFLSQGRQKHSWISSIPLRHTGASHQGSTKSLPDLSSDIGCVLQLLRDITRVDHCLPTISFPPSLQVSRASHLQNNKMGGCLGWNAGKITYLDQGSPPLLWSHRSYWCANTIPYPLTPHTHHLPGPNELSIIDKELIPYILGGQGMPRGPCKWERCLSRVTSHSNSKLHPIWISPLPLMIYPDRCQCGMPDDSETRMEKTTTA